MQINLKLCLVTHIEHQPFHAYQDFLLNAIAGGVTAIQLRDKHKNKTAFYELALQLKKILTPLHIPLIINDQVDIAKAIEADGIHLGQSDLSPLKAREILGQDKIIGWSIESLAELEKANELTCLNYVAASAVFESRTKLDCKTIWGIQGLKQMVELSAHPVIAIGGINASNVKAVIETGVLGVAVVSAIHHAADPKAAAADLLAIIQAEEAKRA